MGVIFDPILGQLRTSDPGGSGSGSVTSVSVVSANGVSGSVANPTTTPAITLTLGAITPTTVNGLTITPSTGTLTIANSKTLTSNNNITISGTDGEALTLTKGLTVTTNAGILAYSAASKTLTVSNNATVSGTNTGDQTITLTGNVTGSGTGSFATTIASSVALAGSPTTTTQTPSDNSTKIATTAYVDNAVLGQNFKEAVGAATTANLVGTYLNGSSGVGATFTYTSTGVDTIDGVTLTIGMRVLLKNQTTTFQNGIYTVTTAGAIGVAGILTRATDADQSGEWKTGDSTFVTTGTTQSTTTWAYTGVDSPTMGTTAIPFVQTAGQGSFTAGNGIAITGNSIAIDISVTVDKTTAQTLTNKTLTTPTIASFTNATHDHSNAAGGGTIAYSALTGTPTIPTSVDDLSPSQTGHSGDFLTTDGTNASWATPSGGGLTWSVITTNTTATADNGYIVNSASLVTLTLPSSASLGDTVRIVQAAPADYGTGGWKVAQPSGHQIFFGTTSTTSGTGGYVSSTATGNTVELVCILAGSSAVWVIASSVGSITVV